MIDDLPLASEEQEETAKDLFQIEIDPEEYAARWAHKIGCSSFDCFCYRDKKLGAWIQKLHKILRGQYTKTIEELRKEYLSEEEIIRIKKDSEEF